MDAYEYLIERRSVNLFEKHKVMSEVELLSRREIYLDIYNKIINVEARTMLMMVKHEIIPAIIDYKDKLANAIIKLNKIDSTYSNVEQNLLKNFVEILDNIYADLLELERVHSQALKANTNRRKAILFRDQVVAQMEKIRVNVDNAEKLLPKDALPFPNYADMLFYE